MRKQTVINMSSLTLQQVVHLTQHPIRFEVFKFQVKSRTDISA